MEIKDIITTVSLIIAFISVVYGIYNNRKSIYINTVTASRIKYLENLRIIIADYAAIIISSKTKIEVNQNQEKIRKLNFLIKLHLDRKHPFDTKMIEKVNVILDLLNSDQKDEVMNEINELIELTQDLVSLEWSGIKNEAIKGIISGKSKKALVENHLKY